VCGVFFSFHNKAWQHLNRMNKSYCKMYNTDERTCIAFREAPPPMMAMDKSASFVSTSRTVYPTEALASGLAAASFFFEDDFFFFFFFAAGGSGEASIISHRLET
jgi:hypothetical protein